MKTTELSDLLAPVVGALGLEIDRIEVLPAGRRKVVRVFLDGDGPDGRGPSLDVAGVVQAVAYPDIDEAVVEVEFNRPLDGDDQDEES
jgi:ribosome maturation factor RimP